MICKIHSCGRAACTRGYCYTHYVRFLSVGDHSKVEPHIDERGKRRAFILSAVSSDQDDCILWPYSTTKGGYPQYRSKGRVSNAHREVCILAHGKPEDGGMHAAHRCGNRLCVNPKHLRWATAKENLDDRREHGTHPSGERQGQAKLTNYQAAMVYVDQRPSAEIARRYGVHRGVVERIKRGQTYKDAAAMVETQMRLVRAGLIKVTT